MKIYNIIYIFLKNYIVVGFMVI